MLTSISWHINGRSLLGIDDANIYFVYMKNFANGHGFVYNIGEERVEGFTSLLWTFIGVVVFGFSKTPEYCLLSINIMIASLNLYLVSKLLHQKNESNFIAQNKYSFAFLVLIGVTPGYIDWTILSLMETGLWSFLLMLTFIISYKNNLNQISIIKFICLNFIYLLLILCRPEAILIVPIFIIGNSIKSYLLNKSINRKVRVKIIISTVIFLSTLSLLTLWRLTYFGFPLPNTYYAKVSVNHYQNIIEGLYYLIKLFIQKPFLPSVVLFNLAIIFLAIFKSNSQVNLSFIYVVLFNIIPFLMPLYSGGDHFGLHRFIMPFLPTLIYLIILTFVHKQKKINIAIFILLYAFSNMYNFRDSLILKSRYPIKHEWSLAVNGRNNSIKLNNFFTKLNKYPSQGVLFAGGQAYTYKGSTIDLLGLNNTRMAHSNRNKSIHLLKNHASFNAEMFFLLDPDVFWYEGCGFSTNSKDFLHIDEKRFKAKVFQNIHKHPKFIQNYGFFRICKANRNNQYLNIFANRKFIKSLDESVYIVREIAFN